MPHPQYICLSLFIALVWKERLLLWLLGHYTLQWSKVKTCLNQDFNQVFSFTPMRFSCCQRTLNSLASLWQIVPCLYFYLATDLCSLVWPTTYPWTWHFERGWMRGSYWFNWNDIVHYTFAEFHFMKYVDYLIILLLFGNAFGKSMGLIVWVAAQTLSCC